MNAHQVSRTLQLEHFGRATVVHFNATALAEDTDAEAVGSQLVHLLDRCPHPYVVLDCSGLGYLQSILIGKFISFQKKFQAKGGQVVFCNVEPHLYEKTFGIMRLAKLFSVYQDEQAALQAAG